MCAGLQQSNEEPLPRCSDLIGLKPINKNRSAYRCTRFVAMSGMRQRKVVMAPDATPDMMTRFAKLDVYPKLEDNYRVKTSTGATGTSSHPSIPSQVQVPIAPGTDTAAAFKEQAQRTRKMGSSFWRPTCRLASYHALVHRRGWLR